MVLILKYNNLHKFYYKNIFKNITFFVFIRKNSSKTYPLPDINCLSNGNLKGNTLKSFCEPSFHTCESILAGNPQSADHRDRKSAIRYEVIKKWEEKPVVRPKIFPALLLGITMFGEVNKN